MSHATPQGPTDIQPNHTVSAILRVTPNTKGTVSKVDRATFAAASTMYHPLPVDTMKDIGMFMPYTPTPPPQKVKLALCLNPPLKRNSANACCLKPAALLLWCCRMERGMPEQEHVPWHEHLLERALLFDLVLCLLQAAFTWNTYLGFGTNLGYLWTQRGKGLVLSQAPPLFTKVEGEVVGVYAWGVVWWGT
jgi:hypothetical protein